METINNAPTKDIPGDFGTVVTPALAVSTAPGLFGSADASRTVNGCVKDIG
jgi:hypothetical protein